MFDVSVGEGAGDETKKKDLHARFLAREAERAEERQRKKADKANRACPAESVDKFWVTFNSIEKDVNRVLAEALDLKDGGDDGAAAIHALLAEASVKLRTLNGNLSNASLYLAPYDSRHARRVIDRLKEAREAAKNELVPRKKFAFKSRERLTKRGARPGGVAGSASSTASSAAEAAAASAGGGASTAASA
eukprot:g900.t1